MLCPPPSLGSRPPVSLAQLSCLGVAEDSPYQTANSQYLGEKHWKTWTAQRAFVALYITSHRGRVEAVQYLLEHGNLGRLLRTFKSWSLLGGGRAERLVFLAPSAMVSWAQGLPSARSGLQLRFLRTGSPGAASPLFLGLVSWEFFRWRGHGTFRRAAERASWLLCLTRRTGDVPPCPLLMWGVCHGPRGEPRAVTLLLVSGRSASLLPPSL